MSNISHIISQAFVLAFLLMSQVVWATVTATLARDEISVNETFQLIVSIDDASLFNRQQPNTDVLAQDFDVLGQSKRSQSSWVNGNKTQKTSWIYTLKAKQAGLFTIPPISIGQQSSKALSLKVAPIKTFQSENGTQANQAIFIEATLEPSDAYVQQQMILNIKFNDSLRLSNIGLSPLNIPQVNMQELSNTSYQRLIGNKTYTTYELRYALFAQKSGVLMIPNIVVSADKLANTGGRRAYEPVRIQSQSISTTIKAIPSDYNYPHWLPAESIELQESYNKDLEQLKVGDAITRTIKLTALGLSAEQLPELSLNNTPGVKIYPEAAKRNNAKAAKKLLQSSISQSFSIVLTEAGTITLPEIQQAWFNTATGKIEIAILAAKTISVMPNPEVIRSQTPTTNDSAANKLTEQAQPQNTNPATVQAIMGSADTSLLPWSELPKWLKTLLYCLITIIAGLLVALIALILRLRTYKSQLQQLNKANNTEKLTTADTQALLKNIRQSIDNQQYAPLRQALITLAQQQLPAAKIIALADMMPFLESGSAQTIKQLDAHLFSAQAAPETSALINLSEAIQTASTNANAVSVFDDLYPQ